MRGGPRDLAPALTRAVDLARTRACSRDAALARELARLLGLAREVDCDLERDLANGELDLIRIRQIIRGLNGVRTAAVGVGGEVIRDLEVARSRADDLADFLRQLGQPDSGHLSSDELHRQPAGVVARRMVAGAARMLPARCRDRFIEEFNAELVEIAAHDGVFAEIFYSGRQFLRAPWLRQSLRSPRRQGVRS